MGEEEKSGGSSAVMIVVVLVVGLLCGLSCAPVVIIGGLTAVGNSLETTFESVQSDIGQP